MAVLETLRILAMEALETCFCRSMRISCSLPRPAKLEVPSLTPAA